MGHMRTSIIFLLFFLLLLTEAMASQSGLENESPIPHIFHISSQYENYTAYYVSPNSSSSDWEAARNPETPRNLKTAIENANSGNLVYLLGGIYNISEPLVTGHSGTEERRVILMNFSDERPVLKADGIEAIIFIENPYWILSGISFEMSNLPDHDHGIVRVGYDHDASHVIIENCTFHLLSTVGHDNLGCIILHSNRSNYAIIRDNIIVGEGTDSDVNFNFGIQYLGGGNVGTRIVHNEIYDCEYGVFVKHANSDNPYSGGEIAYNYVHNCTVAFYGNPVNINYHDNLAVGGGFDFGDNGGGPQGNNCTLIHNTVVDGGIHLWSPSEGPIRDFVIGNNIFYSRSTDAYNGDTLAFNYWDYNLYVYSPSVGNHDISNETPVFSGGTGPSGYALADNSPGKWAASDHTDIGANVSLVGPHSPSRAFFPPQPFNLTAESGAGYANLTWKYENSGFLLGFKVYRDGIFIHFSFMGDMCNIFNDTDLSEGENHTYFVTSLGVLGESEKSNIVEVPSEGIPEVSVWIFILTIFALALHRRVQ